MPTTTPSQRRRVGEDPPNLERLAREWPPYVAAFAREHHLDEADEAHLY